VHTLATIAKSAVSAVSMTIFSSALVNRAEGRLCRSIAARLIDVVYSAICTAAYLAGVVSTIEVYSTGLGTISHETGMADAKARIVSFII